MRRFETGSKTKEVNAAAFGFALAKDLAVCMPEETVGGGGRGLGISDLRLCLRRIGRSSQ
jgi:hypothetical protein